MSVTELFDDFAATGDAAIPAGRLPPAELAAFSARWKQVSTSRNADYDPAPLIREFLQRGASEGVRYLDGPSSPVRDPQMLNAHRKQRMALLKQARTPDATRRCPCGSGKMFKNCCLKRPR